MSFAVVVLVIGGAVSVAALGWLALAFFMPRAPSGGTIYDRADLFEADDFWEWSALLAFYLAGLGLAVAAVGALLVLVS
jgi:hypothetical protein